MKQISETEYRAFPTKSKVNQDVLDALAALKPHTGLLIVKEDWKLKSNFTTWFKYHRQRFLGEFQTKVLINNQGWAILRIK